MSKLWCETLGYKALPASRYPENRLICLTPGIAYYYRVEANNKKDENSAIFNYYQIGIESFRNASLLALLNLIMKEPFFDILRTKEQLGYVVRCGVNSQMGIKGFGTIIQSNTKDAAFLDDRIEHFFQTSLEMLQNLSQEEFQKNINALIVQTLEKDKRLAQETTRLWEEIVSRKYIFDRAQREVEEIKTFTKDDVIQFFKQFVLQVETRSKISVQVFSASRTIPTDVPPRSKLITDPSLFKRSMSLHPAL